MKSVAYKLVVGLMAVATCTGWGQTVPTNRVVSSLTPAEIQQRRLAFTGGMVVKRELGSAILLMDTRKANTPCYEMDFLSKDLESAFGVSFRVARRAAVRGERPIKIAQAALQDKDVGVVIVVSDEDLNTPGLSVFPEDRIALLNATRICEGAANKEVASKRLSTETWRAIAFVAGGVNSYVPHCVLSSLVLEPKDLDQLSSCVASPSVCEQVSRAADKLGLGKVKTTTYRVACVQGWAPTPTNEIQKAIWEDVKNKANDPRRKVRK